MDKQTNPTHLEHNLELFGLSASEAQVYLTLLECGWVTVLDLSRKIAIKRPTLYRIIEELVKKGMIEVKIGDKTTYYTAASPDQLTTLITEKEQKLADIKTLSLPLINELKILKQIRPQETDVIFYRGKRGMEYALIQEFKEQNGTVFIFDTDRWWGIVKDKFSGSIRERIVDNNITLYEFHNEVVYQPIPKSLEVSWTKNKQYLAHHYFHRLLPKKVLDITQDIVIFNDTTHFYGVKSKELFVIEIKDSDLAEMFKCMFKMYWNMAKKNDNRGGLNLS